jgi:hypothetical protein
MRIEVDCCSGYKFSERPMRFHVGATTYEVKTVLDRWYGPDDEWFKVGTDTGDIYILRYRAACDEWTLTSFRSG